MAAFFNYYILYTLPRHHAKAALCTGKPEQNCAAGIQAQVL